MGIIAWIFLGLFAGLIARALVPGRTEPGGCFGTTAVGILGALIGGFIASALDIGHVDEFLRPRHLADRDRRLGDPAADHPRDRPLRANPDEFRPRTGTRVESGGYHVVRNGRVASHRAFSDVDEALSAAGLGSGERLENPS